MVAVGWSATGDRTLNEVTNANSATTTWEYSLATPIAAGFGSDLRIVDRSPWFAPNSEQVRDIMMSTGDRGYDPFVQGAGWVNVSRAVDTILGVNGSMSIGPRLDDWRDGWAHRDANLNMILPVNQSAQIELTNPGLTQSRLILNPKL